MPVSSTADLSLLEANLNFLVGLDPALGAQLRKLTRTVTRPIVENDSVVDIDLGSGRLYGQHGAAFAEEQVSSYLAQPTRIAVAAPDAAKLNDPVTIEMVRRFETCVAESGTSLPEMPPADRCGLLLVAGIGLGFHLEPLIAATGPHHIVLVEPIAEFLLHAAGAFDWRALSRFCEERAATLSIVIADDLEGLTARVDTLLAGFGETAIDGSYLYLHYGSPATEAVAARVYEFAGMQSILKGYFDDERLMIENMTANVAARDFRMIDGVMQKALDVPVFIVGSGPSLDGSIAAIRKNRDRAIVIAAGSALQALLHHDIVPDFQVEKENSAVTVDRLRHIVERFPDRFPDGRFAGVSLLAAATVAPEAIALFDDVYLFQRTSLSSTAMFGAGHRPVDGTSPFSANAALMLAAVLGFREVYLFGCDCGARDGAGHHSAQTVYYTRPESRDTGRIDFPHRAPANFGGEVCTNPFFVWSRQTHEQVIAAAGLEVRNCSDGIAIAAAPPLRPDTLDLSSPVVDRAKLAAQVQAPSTWYPAGGYLRGQDIAGAVAGWTGFARDLLDFIDVLDREAEDIHAFHRRIGAFLDTAETRYGGAAVLTGGTVRALSALASYYLNRIAQVGDGADLFDWFRALHRQLVAEMLARGDVLMTMVSRSSESAALQSA